MGCVVNGCTKPEKVSGMCWGHYARRRRHGAAEGGSPSKTESGIGRKWIEDNVLHAEDDCLIWPFSSTKVTFVRVDGQARKTYVYMCELVNGPRPTPAHQAAHSCGKRHLGCVNPRHLRWATPKENMADKKLHGTQACGETAWNAKFTAEDVRLIRDSIGKVPGRELARRFGVSDNAISKIRRGHNWQGLT